MHPSEDSREESAAGGGGVSSSSTEDRGQASAGSRVQKLSVSLSVNLLDDSNVQLAEAAASSLGSRSRDEEGDSDCDPVEGLVVHQVHRFGHVMGLGGHGERASARYLASPQDRLGGGIGYSSSCR